MKKAKKVILGVSALSMLGLTCAGLAFPAAAEEEVDTASSDVVLTVGASAKVSIESNTANIVMESGKATKFTILNASEEEEAIKHNVTVAGNSGSGYVLDMYGATTDLVGQGTAAGNSIQTVEAEKAITEDAAEWGWNTTGYVDGDTTWKSMVEEEDKVTLKTTTSAGSLNQSVYFGFSITDDTVSGTYKDTIYYVGYPNA